MHGARKADARRTAGPEIVARRFFAHRAVVLVRTEVPAQSAAVDIASRFYCPIDRLAPLPRPPVGFEVRPLGSNRLVEGFAPGRYLAGDPPRRIQSVEGASDEFAGRTACCHGPLRGFVGGGEDVRLTGIDLALDALNDPVALYGKHGAF